MFLNLLVIQSPRRVLLLLLRLFMKRGGHNTPRITLGTILAHDLSPVSVVLR